ncbi:MAG: hypothetical protein A2075_23100 [Geobacteraceae bacterium GWC2_58_44]|nr:MAG: hypothetical protein A2075_23100 [Geobacteraceae bacterium GWC2_58_44]HBG06779.1 hypothetical protein [Geobacter sp.]
MNWYHLTVDGDQAAGKVQQYKEAFEKAFAAARGPRTMALFQRERDGGGVDLYFTPEAGRHAAQLLEEWGCTPCESPSLMGLQLLVGHNEITYYMT